MTSYVYFIQEGDVGPVKIGFTDRTITGRLNSLQHGNGRPLRFIGLQEGGRPEETRWHKRFHAFRLEREWFLASPELLAAIRSECIIGARLDAIVQHHLRGRRALGENMAALHRWMDETGRTPEGIAEEIGWSPRVVVKSLLGHGYQRDGLGMYLAAAVARISEGRFSVSDLVAPGCDTSGRFRRMVEREAASKAQPVSA